MRSPARRCAAEMIGTYFLVLMGPGAVMVNAWTGGAVSHVGVALAFAFVVLAVIYAIGHLSGAHINPAVTIGFWSVRRFPAGDTLLYIVAQCAGAVLAALTLRWALGPVGDVGATVPAIAVPAAFAVEWLLSFILMFVIMAVATDARVADGVSGLAVGLTVGCNALMGGLLTGASMNPARTLGPAVASGTWAAHWIYWLAPITAMVAAARVYDVLRRVDGTVAREPAAVSALPSSLELPNTAPARDRR